MMLGKFTLHSRTIVAFLLSMGFFAMSQAISPVASALSGSDFNKANIISDAVFFNGNSMTASQIQSFLNSKLAVCDTDGSEPYGGTTRAAYGASRGYPAPYTCLKDYRQTIPSRAADAYCSGSISGGNKSSSQIIYDVSRACGVSPKALIVLLQKEQSLVTDDWPWSIQYRSATGYGCPDTAPCDSEYYGFFNQVYNAARQFKRYVAQPDYFNYAVGRRSFVGYNPNAGCGGNNVTIQNGATAALYNYTPYQPNAAALANLYGTGDSCSAYGNRNFWRMFNDWFGSTQVSYAGTVTSARLYTDSARTNEVSGTPSIRSGVKLYATVDVLNTGNRAWDQSTAKLGTANAKNRSSGFYDTESWQSESRAASMTQASIAPNQTATFSFALKAPGVDGTYGESFQVVIEGVSWVQGAQFTETVTVSNPYNAKITSIESFGDEARTQRMGGLTKTGSTIFWRVRAQNTGTSTWSNSTVRIGTTTPLNRTSDVSESSWFSANRPARLSEGSVAPGSTGTFIYATTSDVTGRFIENFSLVAEGHSWMPGSGYMSDIRFIDQIDRLLVNDRLYVGETLRNGTIRMVLQGDGNLVVYNASGRPVWSSGTRGGNRLIMQGDGNLVMYSADGKPVWNTGTKNGHRLIMQGDGNLVIYNTSNKAIWNSGTKR